MFMGVLAAETQHGEDALALGAVEGAQPTMVWALALVRPTDVQEVQEAQEAQRI